MCTTCGCHSDSEHSHDKHHDEHHDANAYHAHPITAQTVIINHHHYHAPVAQYFYSSPSTDDTHIHQPTSDCATHIAPLNHEDTLDYGQGEAGGHTPGLSQHRIVEIEKNVLSKNNHIAAHNREHFKEDHLLVLNLVSSPGSGKTTLLTETLHCLMPHTACMVIEGDQQTANDAERIRATGAKAIQINTGKGCHLDAQMVHDAVHELNPEANSLLFIENVGNLVCPASFDLGEMHKVVVLSVTEGEDKPLKYPHMFAASRLLLINKIDLLPYIDFDLTRCIDYAKQVNPQIEVILISAATGEGMEQWLTWLEQQQCA